MPPKPKYTREEIIAVALDLVSRNGVDKLTARELGSALHSSARPIFTVFKNMEELQAEVHRAAMVRFESYVQQTNDEIPVFKQIGLQTILFAVKEPKLYQLLFMQEHKQFVSFDDVFHLLGKTAQRCVDSLCEVHFLSVDQAKTLFEAVWIYTFGIGVLSATGMCHFSEKQLSEMLSTEFQGMLQYVQSK